MGVLEAEAELPQVTVAEEQHLTALKHKARPVKASHPLDLSSSAPVSALHRPDSQPTPHAVWLYTLVGADYPGTAAMLPHWLSHYLALGFQKEHMIIVVNQNSTSASAQAEMAAVKHVLDDQGLPFTLWPARYSSDAHLKVKLQLLDGRVQQPEDWIVIVDSDEFVNFGHTGLPIQHFLGAVERQGSNWVLGMLVDRVTADGQLADILPEPTIFKQFPLNCFVVKRLTGGFVWKTPAFKAFWRSNTGNHYIVQPHKAAQYFGAAPVGVRNSRGGYSGAEDLYALTPYAKLHDKYQYEGLDEGQEERAGLWAPLRHEDVLAVHHFKWHAGVLPSATDRLAYYKGDIADTGQPRFQHYTESETILAMLAESRAVPIKEAQCKPDPALQADKGG